MKKRTKSIRTEGHRVWFGGPITPRMFHAKMRKLTEGIDARMDEALENDREYAFQAAKFILGSVELLARALENTPYAAGVRCFAEPYSGYDWWVCMVGLEKGDGGPSTLPTPTIRGLPDRPPPDSGGSPA